MSADNAIVVYKSGEQWIATNEYVSASQDWTKKYLSNYAVGNYEEKADALLAASQILEQATIVEYGIIVIDFEEDANDEHA